MSTATEEKLTPYAARVNMMEKHLEKNGWKRSGRTDRTGQSWWWDPAGTLKPGEARVTGETKARGGGTVALKQYVAPPIPWDYPLDEAYQMQTTRDEEKKNSNKGK